MAIRPTNAPRTPRFVICWSNLGQSSDAVARYENTTPRRSRSPGRAVTQAAFVEETGIDMKPDPFFMFMLHCTAYAVHNPAGGNLRR